jgi:hypothetical protein
VSASWATALEELSGAWPALEEVVRVDVDDEGGLVLTATGAGTTRWFTHDDRGLIERFPAQDPKVLLAGRLAHTSDWRVLSYRPGRRMVVRVDRPEGPLVIKGHKKGRSTKAAAKQRIAERAMSRGSFRVPKMLLHEPEREAMAFEWLAGREVELGPGCESSYRRLGEGLRIFQADPAALDLETHLVDAEFDVLAKWVAKVESAVGELPAGWSAAHGRLVEAARGLPGPELGLAHRDLHDRQVHSIDGHVALLDFDLLCRADVALDPANLLAHLDWRAEQGLHGATADSVRGARAAFLGGLARDGSPAFGARFSFWSAAAHLRIALVYRLRPRWAGRVPALVRFAEQHLDDPLLAV